MNETIVILGSAIQALAIVLFVHSLSLENKYSRRLTALDERHNKDIEKYEKFGSKDLISAQRIERDYIFGYRFFGYILSGASILLIAMGSIGF